MDCHLRSSGPGLTESRVKHVKGHLVAFLCAGDGDKTFVAVVGRLVDFDDTTAQLTNLVDLRSTLTNNGADHIVGNKNLLG